MLSQAELQRHQVRYSVLAALLGSEGACKDGTQPALRHFGTALTRRIEDGQGVPPNIPGNGKRNGFHRLDLAAGSFMAELQQETLRLRRAIAALAEGLWMELLAIAQELPALGGHGGALLEERAKATWSRCDAIGASLVAVDAFVRVSVAALAQLAESKDKGNHLGSLQPTNESSAYELAAAQDPLYLACFHTCILDDTRLEPILVGLSDVYEALRQLQEGRAISDTAWEPPTIFTRETTKFWLRPQDAMHFKSEIIKHVPFLIFAKRQKLTSGGKADSLRFLQQQTVTDWSTVTSVYFDDREMQAYMSRLRRDDLASAIRVRWYGQRTRAANQELFVERKVHREPWTGERSCKERCPVLQEHLLPFLNGEGFPPVDSASSECKLLMDVQEQLLEWNQEPMLRTVCDRVAFQETSSDMVRISLDTHLHMISELDAPHAQGDWCRDSRAPLLPGEVVHFPYCVVEMKLRLNQPPAWLQAMVTSGTLLHAPRFSKYLHGAAGLFADTVEKMPYWYLHNSDGTMSPATWEEMADDADDFYDENAAPWMFPTQDEVPLLGRIRNFLQRKTGGSSTSGLSLEAKGTQGIAELRQVKAEQARDELQSAAVIAKSEVDPPTLGNSDVQRRNRANLSVCSSVHATGYKSEPTSATTGAIGPGNEATQQPGCKVNPGTVMPCDEEVQRRASFALPRDEDSASGIQLDLPRPLLQAAEPEQLAKVLPGQYQLQRAAFHRVDIEAPAVMYKGAPAQRDNLPGQPSPQTWWANPLALLPGRTTAKLDAIPPDPPGADKDGNGEPKEKLVQASYRSKALVRSRVEPKTFFANERTFLAWLHIAVLIMLTGLSLLGGTFSSVGGSSSACTQPSPPPPPPKTPKHAPPPGSPLAPMAALAPVVSTYNSFNCRASKYAGIAISPVAVLFMIYALYMYKKRTIQIMQQRKSVRYDDQRGPVLLVVLLVAALLAAMIFTAKAAFEQA